MKRNLIMLLVISLFAVHAAPVTAEDKPIQLTDIAGHWADDAIIGAVQKGYVSGYLDETFRPNQNVTRAEFIKMLVDALKLPKSTGGSPWYQGYVSAAVEFGIHHESDYTDYQAELTRQEMVRLAVRAVAKEDYASDEEMMYAATQRGILHGMEHGMLMPEGTSTRAQAVAIIERILAVKAGETLPVDERAITYAEVEWKGSNVESAWGVKLKPLPIKLDLGGNVDVEIDKVVIVDYTDKDAAYRQWMPKMLKARHGDVVDQDYVVALHVNVVNKNMKDHVSWDFNFSVEGTKRAFQHAAIVENRDKTIFQPVPSFMLDLTEKVDGWFLMAIPKKEVEAGGINKEIVLGNLVHQRLEILTEE